jgi:hypothetical protein
MRVLIFQTQYNTPAESNCTGGPQQITIWNNSCQGTAGTVRSGFDFRVTNPLGGTGSGHSINFGDVQEEASCPGRQAGDLRGFVTIRGSLGPVNDSTVAVCRTGPLFIAGLRLFIVGEGVKTVTDSCPACCNDPGMAHLDNYTTNTACAGVPSLPDAKTIVIF